MTNNLRALVICYKNLTISRDVFKITAITLYHLKYWFTVTNQRQIEPDHRSLLADKGDPFMDNLANNRNNSIFRNPLITCLYLITAYLASRTDESDLCSQGKYRLPAAHEKKFYRRQMYGKM